jgi:Concanavalin A-like lectin/glucanases superfamily
MARTFSGTAQWLEQNSAILTVPPISFGGWLYISALNSNFMGIGSGGASQSSYELFYGAANIATGIINAAGALTSMAAPPTVPALSVWSHVLGVFPNATTLTIYLNGVKVTQAIAAAPTAANLTKTTLGAIYNGGSTTSPRPPMNGRLAWTAFWNAALTDADALSLANGASPNLVQPSKRVSYARLTGGQSPEPDFVLPTGWTITGSPTQSANPRMFCP